MRVGMDLPETEGDCTVRELYLSFLQPASFIVAMKSKSMIWVVYASEILEIGYSFSQKGLKKRLVGRPMRR